MALFFEALGMFSRQKFLLGVLLLFFQWGR